MRGKDRRKAGNRKSNIKTKKLRSQKKANNPLGGN